MKSFSRFLKWWWSEGLSCKDIPARLVAWCLTLWCLLEIAAIITVLVTTDFHQEYTRLAEFYFK